MATAGVGNRVGRRTISTDLTSTFKSWDDARAAYETWAVQLRDNLAARRNGTPDETGGNGN